MQDFYADFKKLLNKHGKKGLNFNDVDFDTLEDMLVKKIDEYDDVQDNKDYISNITVDYLRKNGETNVNVLTRYIKEKTNLTGNIIHKIFALSEYKDKIWKYRKEDGEYKFYLSLIVNVGDKKWTYNKS